MSLVDIGEGPLCHVIEFLDVECLSRASSSCRSLRRWSRSEWERRDRAILDIGRSQAEDARTRVIRYFQAQRFAIQDEEKHFPNGESRQPVFDERDNRMVEDTAAYEFFLRISQKQVSLEEKITVWQDFVPLINPAQVATIFGEGYDHTTLPVSGIYLNLHGAFPHMQWQSLSKMLRALEQASPRTNILNAVQQDPFKDLSVTVGAVSKMSAANYAPVLYTGNCENYLHSHPLFGFDMYGCHLPGRIVRSALFTNIPRLLDWFPTHPQLDVLSIHQHRLSADEEQRYLAEIWGPYYHDNMYDNLMYDNMIEAMNADVYAWYDGLEEFLEDIDGLDEDDAIDGGDEDDIEGEEVDEDDMD